MSRTIMLSILSELFVRLNERETEELYQELLAHFNLVGASDHCQVLESAWNDEYNKRQIEEFIKAWLIRRQRKKPKPIVGLV